MSENHRVRVAVIGCGSMARGHVHSMLRQQDSTEIAVLCDPSGEAIAQMNAQFAALGLPRPPMSQTWTSCCTTTTGSWMLPSS